MTTYNVYSLDVWGNAEDGYEVNDRYPLGKVEISDINDDTGILQALFDADYGSPPDGEVEIVGDEDYLSIDVDGRPVLQLGKVIDD